MVEEKVVAQALVVEPGSTHSETMRSVTGEVTFDQVTPSVECTMTPPSPAAQMSVSEEPATEVRCVVTVLV